MDYEVGSLSDLITGKNTPNKPKVVKKKLTPKIEKAEDDAIVDEILPKLKAKRNSTSENDSPKKSKKKKSLSKQDTVESPKKKKKQLNNNDSVASQSDLDTSVGGKTKKRKLKEILDDNAGEEEEVSPKKSKNDLNAERRVKDKLKAPKIQPTEEENARTIFVGNLPITTTKKQLRKLFKKYGDIDSMRIRGVTPADPRIKKKVAIIKNQLHPKRTSFYAYVKFVTEESAVKAVESNGELFLDHHIRVHQCSNKDTPDESKAIFVGNLPFDAEDEELWKLFEPCGAIESVRIVRDKGTGMGRGIGYVNFHSADSVQLALEMEDIKLKERELRVTLCNKNAAKKNNQKKISKPRRRRNRKDKPEKTGEQQQEGEGGDGEEKKTFVKTQGFQGTKVDNKKKNKLNKGTLQKKKMMKKIAPKHKISKS